MKKTVTVLGATGSIGTSTMDLIGCHRDLYEVVALTANTNVTDLASLAKDHHPNFVALADESKYGLLKEALSNTSIEIAAGHEAIIRAAELSSDWVMSSIMGAAGLEPTLSAIRRGAQVAFANKETLVCAGDLMMKELNLSDAKLLPVDSEHNAIYQVFDNNQRQAIEKIYLTGSGGPFRTWSYEQMKAATPAQAVQHPNWSMGAKISVDSATMMNKGLELIEACYLFAMPESKIDILVHPQSVIHSMVGYADGSVLAQLGTPDMRTPISYCLSWPDRIQVPVTPLDFVNLSRLDFQAPDDQKFPSLKLARGAIKEGRGAPTILNAANEIAVDAFLKEKIKFLDIAALVEEVLLNSPRYELTRIEEVIELDYNARVLAKELLVKFSI